MAAGQKRQSGWKTARHSDSSQGFIRDFALVWAEEGLEAVRKVSPERKSVFRDSDRQQRAKRIARLNNCSLTLDEKSEVATFTRIA